MRILLNENISFRVVKFLNAFGFTCVQVRELNLEAVNDTVIWDFAKNENYTIVTFDSDYDDLVTLYGHPPKVIWLRIGNTSTQNLIKTFEKHFDIIKAFLTDENYNNIGCLEIY